MMKLVLRLSDEIVGLARIVATEPRASLLFSLCIYQLGQYSYHGRIKVFVGYLHSIVPLWLAHKGMSGAGRRGNAVRFRQGTKIHQNTNRFHRSRRSPWRDGRARHFASRFMAGAHPFTQSSTAFE